MSDGKFEALSPLRPRSRLLLERPLGAFGTPTALGGTALEDTHGCPQQSSCP